MAKGEREVKSIVFATLLPYQAATDEAVRMPVLHTIAVRKHLEEQLGLECTLLLASAWDEAICATSKMIRECSPDFDIEGMLCPYTWTKQHGARRPHEIAAGKTAIARHVLRNKAVWDLMYFFDSDLSVKPETVYDAIVAVIPGQTFSNIPYCLRDMLRAPGEQFGCHVMCTADMREKAIATIYQTEIHPDGNLGVVGADDCNFRFALLEQGLKECRITNGVSYHYSLGDPKVPDRVNVYLEGACSHLELRLADPITSSVKLQHG